MQEETVPVTVLKPYLAESSNALDLKGLVSKTPGVSILDGQVSIRGGSGYVMVLGAASKCCWMECVVVRGFGGDLVVLPPHGARFASRSGQGDGLVDVRIWRLKWGHPYENGLAW